MTSKLLLTQPMRNTGFVAYDDDLTRKTIPIFEKTTLVLEPYYA